MRENIEQSEEFVIKEMLRQEGASNHTLFIIIIDDVLKEIKSKIKQTHVGYKCLETMSIAECIFADDLVVFTKNRSG